MVSSLRHGIEIFPSTVRSAPTPSQPSTTTSSMVTDKWDFIWVAVAIPLAKRLVVLHWQSRLSMPNNGFLQRAF